MSNMLLVTVFVCTDRLTNAFDQRWTPPQTQWLFSTSTLQESLLPFSGPGCSKIEWFLHHPFEKPCQVNADNINCSDKPYWTVLYFERHLVLCLEKWEVKRRDCEGSAAYDEQGRLVVCSIAHSDCVCGAGGQRRKLRDETASACRMRQHLALSRTLLW